MSAIEYNSLVFQISRRLDELNVLRHLRFMFRGKLEPGSEDNIHDALSLFKELEEHNILGADRLVEMKELLSDVEEWSLLEKVEKFESKRKEYRYLLDKIIRALDELNELERLIAMCRGKIPEESEDQIREVRSLFEELENQNNLGIYHLDILKVILTEVENTELLKEVEKFEERRKQEATIKRKKAKAAAFVSSVGNTLIGVLNIKTVFKVVAGGITVVSIMEVLSRWSTFDQLVTAVDRCVLPAGTSLVNLTDGCVCLTVQAESLSALTTLWSLYQNGTLERRLYNFFVTDEVKEQAGGETVEVNVSIEEEEYDKARLELMNEEAASIGDGERIRRNSDSDVYSRTREELPPVKPKHDETERKFLKERIAVIEKEMKYSSPQFLEARGPGERAAFLKQLGISEGRKVGEMNEITDELEMSQWSKAKSMDPGKFAFVQKYLEDVQDTRSMTTEASDSGLATHTAASELGTEEINEADKLCLKDLSMDVMMELNQRLQADEAAMEKINEFFGLSPRFGLIDLKDLFPDTPVSVMKKCFEALWMFDLAEIMEKIKSRSLRPALSPEQTEKLRKADDRPTKHHSNVAVLVVNHSVQGDFVDLSVEGDEAKKIETFFKDLNSRNEVAIISLVSSQETLEAQRKIKEKYRGKSFLHLQEDSLRKRLKYTLQKKAPAEKQLEEVMHMERKQLASRRVLGIPQKSLKQQEFSLRSRLENVVKEIEQTERDFKKLRELEKESTKPILTAMDELIHNQDTFTCVAVFIISDDELYSEAMLEECVTEKLAIIPDHTKLVVSPSKFKSLAEVPETLHVSYHASKVFPTFISMIEIFNKRWQTLDVISMMQELKRTAGISFKYDGNPFIDHMVPCLSIKNSLSTLPTFQKKEEEHFL